MTEDGTFRVGTGAALPAADDPWVLVRSPGWAPVAIRFDDDRRRAFEEKGSVEGVRVVLHRAATVAGRVRKPNGDPFPQARVGFSRDPSAREPDDDQAFTVTDDDGRYVLTEADPRAALYLVVEAWPSRMRPVALAGRLEAGRTVNFDVDMFEIGEAR